MGRNHERESLRHSDADIWNMGFLLGMDEMSEKMTLDEYEKQNQREMDSWANDEPPEDVYQHLAFTEKLILVARLTKELIRGEYSSRSEPLYPGLDKALKEIGL